MKQKTPLAEAKKQISELWSSPSDQPTYTQILEVLDQLMPKEKEVIISAYNENENYMVDGIDAESYFNETFTQK